MNDKKAPRMYQPGVMYGQDVGSDGQPIRQTSAVFRSMYQPGAMYGADVGAPAMYQPGVMYGNDVTPDGRDIRPGERKVTSQQELEERAYQEEAMRQAQQKDPYANILPMGQGLGVQYSPEQAMAINQMIYGENFAQQQTPNPLMTRYGLQAQVRQPANQQNMAQLMADGVLSAMTGETAEFSEPGEKTLLDTAAAQGFLEQLGRFEPR